MDEASIIDGLERGEVYSTTNNTNRSSLNERRVTTTSSETPYTILENFEPECQNDVLEKGYSIVVIQLN